MHTKGYRHINRACCSHVHAPTRRKLCFLVSQGTRNRSLSNGPSNHKHYTHTNTLAQTYTFSHGFFLFFTPTSTIPFFTHTHTHKCDVHTQPQPMARTRLSDFPENEVASAKLNEEQVTTTSSLSQERSLVLSVRDSSSFTASRWRRGRAHCDSVSQNPPSVFKGWNILLLFGATQQLVYLYIQPHMEQ